MSLFESAERNWPEDEARSSVECYKNALLDGEQYAKTELEKDKSHMRKVFREHLDAENLIERYEAEIARLLEENE